MKPLCLNCAERPARFLGLLRREFDAAVFCTLRCAAQFALNEATQERAWCGIERADKPGMPHGWHHADEECLSCSIERPE